MPVVDPQLGGNQRAVIGTNRRLPARQAPNHFMERHRERKERNTEKRILSASLCPSRSLKSPKYDAVTVDRDFPPLPSTLAGPEESVNQDLIPAFALSSEVNFGEGASPSSFF